MGIFIAAFSKNKIPVTRFLTAKLYNGELETNINTDFDDISVYSNRQDTICIINFVTGNTVYRAEETYFSVKEEDSYTCIQGDIILRNKELCDMNFLPAGGI